jgi:hypothetical protein
MKRFRLKRILPYRGPLNSIEDANELELSIMGDYYFPKILIRN